MSDIGEIQHADPKHLSFWGHIGVLRNYIILGGLVFVVVASWTYEQYNVFLTTTLLSPLHGQTLIFLSPLGPFLFKVKIAVYSGLILSFPFWLGQLLHFASPALSKTQRTILWLFALASIVLGAASLLLTYIYLLPTSLAVLQSFAVPGTISTLTAESYLSFCIMEFILVYIVLQIPVVMNALAYARILDPRMLTKHRRFTTIGIVTVLAIVTPTTDAVTLMVVSALALVLWEVGIATSRFMYNKRI